MHTGIIGRGVAAAFIALIVGGGASSWAANVSSPPATSYQINDAHNGATKFSVPLKFPLTQAWHVQLPGLVSYPIVAGHQIYVTVGEEQRDNTGALILALDEASGAVIWQQTISASYRNAGAAYGDGALFVLNDGGLIKALDAKTGRLRWSASLPAGAQGSSRPSPVVSGMTLYVLDLSGLYAYDTRTGALKWSSFAYDADGFAALVGGNLYVSSGCDAVDFDSLTGAQVWHVNYGCSGGGLEYLVYGDGRLFVPTFSSNGIDVLNAQTGSTLLSISLGSPPAVAGSTAYFVHTDGGLSALQAVDIASGATRWSFAGDQQFNFPPIVVGDVVLAMSKAWNFYALNTRTGKQLWNTTLDSGKKPVCCGGPYPGLAAADGLVLVPAGTTLTAFISN